MIKKEKLYKKKQYIPQVGAKLSYKHIKTDIHGYVNAQDFLPKPYDLCELVVQNKKRLYKGYHTGTAWDGRKIEKNWDIEKWKKIPPQYDHA